MRARLSRCVACTLASVTLLRIVSRSTAMPLCRAISSCSATHRYTVGYSHRGGAPLCAQRCERRRDLVARIGCEVCQRTAALGLYVPTHEAALRRFGTAIPSIQSRMYTVATATYRAEPERSTGERTNERTKAPRRSRTTRTTAHEVEWLQRTCTAIAFGWAPMHFNTVSTPPWHTASDRIGAMRIRTVAQRWGTHNTVGTRHC